jgi:hypothetical protein
MTPLRTIESPIPINKQYPTSSATRLHGHWTAWFADSPETAFGGEWPAEAIQRLVATVPGLDVERLTADHEQSLDDRLVFVLADSEVCSECGGSGEVVSHHPT